jgi:membrane protein
MASRLRNIYDTLAETTNKFLDDHATKHSASLAYYTIFSAGPLLMVIITLLGFFYKKPYVTNQVFDQLGSIVGAAPAKQLQSMLETVSHQNHSTLFGVIGVLVLIFGATGIFTEIQSSINYLWSIRAKPKRSWLKYITDRLLSFLLILSMGLLMILALLINIIFDLLSGRLHSLLGDATIVLLKGVNFSILLVVVVSLFWIIYKILPDARIHWKDALIGATFTGVLFIIGKYLITYYLSFARGLSAYGAAASIVLLLTWIYYSALIVYYGAEFTEVYSRRWGKGITVNDNAVYIVKLEEKKLPELKQPLNES